MELVNGNVMAEGNITVGENGEINGEINGEVVTVGRKSYRFSYCKGKTDT